MKDYVVVRVDINHPKTWFKGYDEFRNSITTIHVSEAAHLNLDEARMAVYGLKLDYRGSVWSIVKAKDYT